MAREIYVEDGSLERRPGIFIIGSPNVGKRTLLSRLLSLDIPDSSDLSGGVLCQGWTIDTKYYSADISIWVAHLIEEFSFGALPMSKQLAGLVMVFDMSDESSFLALKDWAESTNFENFEILLCIGNKADLIPGHSAHAEYRRYLQKRGESSRDPHPEFWDYGINEAEGFSLLGDEEHSQEIRKSCLEWCVEHNIEYVEACASNADFDKCLSVNGDIQGVQRLCGALSAHMWPGMVMKSGERFTAQLPTKEEDMTDDESDYEVEYEVLSRGSDEPWEYVGVSSNDLPSASGEVKFTEEQFTIRNIEDLEPEITGNGKTTVEISNSKASAGASSSHCNDLPSEPGVTQQVSCGDSTIEDHHCQLTYSEDAVENHPSTSHANVREELEVETAADAESNEDSYYGHEDLERLVCEIGSMRDNLRLMPDFQRREMAAKLAMKMASMFGDNSDVDDDENWTKF